MQNQSSLRQVVVVGHPSLLTSLAEAEKIAASLQKEGIAANAYGTIYDETLRQEVQAHRVDVLIAVGGDGSMLRASHLCASQGIPVLGVNMGRFGFLTEIKPQEWQEFMPRLLGRDYRVEERMMLHAQHLRAGKELASWDVLNEVVVSRGQYVRPIHISAVVDGYPLAEYTADGLIAATPTGSTAYALAVGGPIMPPELRNILVIPVAPHLSIDRAMILSEGAHVTITTSTTHQAVISADGHPPDILENGDTVEVAAGCCKALFIRFHDPGYFYRSLTIHMEQNPSQRSTQQISAPTPKTTP
jgi:NAD+ kinase